jgi:Flp pilus assembly protein TadD
MLALLVGGAYGYYVWSQIQPRPIAQYIAPPVPVPAAEEIATAPVAAPSPSSLEQREPAPRIAKQSAPPAIVRHHVTRKQSSPLLIVKQPLDDSMALLQVAYASYQSGDFAAAWQQYNMALQQDNTNRDALLGLAAIARRQGADAQAAQYYRQLITLDPRDPDAAAGIAALEQGGGINQESHLKLLLEQQPQSSALHFALGNLYAAQSRWAEAQHAYFDAYALQPGAAQYACDLAVSLDHLGQTKLATQYYQRALQLDAAGGAGFDHEQVDTRLHELQAH